MGAPMSADGLELVVRDGRWWFDAPRPESREEVESLVGFVESGLAAVAGSPDSGGVGTLHGRVLRLLATAGALGREAGGPHPGFRAKCREYADYLAAKCAENGLPEPGGMGGGLDPSSRPDARGTVLGVVREVLTHLGNHLREDPALPGRSAGQAASAQSAAPPSLVATKPRPAEPQLSSGPASTVRDAMARFAAWRDGPEDAPLPASVHGLLDLVATGLADLGFEAPQAPARVDRAWIAGFLRALAPAGEMVPPAAASARTQAMAEIVREHVPYHTRSLDPGEQLRTSFQELISHLAVGFVERGRVPHCGAAGRALIAGAVNSTGTGRYVPPRPRFDLFGHDTAFVGLNFGPSLFVDLADDSVTPEIVQTGWWEPWIDGVVRKSVGRGDVAVNVGANQGYHTLLISHCVEDAGRVFAFEPNPRLVPRLGRSIRWAGMSRTMLFPLAVSDREGRTTIHFTPEMAGHGGFYPASDQRWRMPPPSGLKERYARAVEAVVASTPESVDVPTTTLDDTVGRIVDEVHFMLLDIEFAEPLALLGGRDLIRRSRDLTIMLEWMNGPTTSPYPELRAQAVLIIEFLTAEGFSFWNIHADPRDLFGSPAMLEPLSPDDVLRLDEKSDLFVRRRSRRGSLRK